MQWWHQSLKSKPTARNVVCLFCFLVFFTIFAQWFMLEGWQQQLDDEIPVDFKDEKEISSNYSEALNQLQDLCLANKNSIIAIGQHKEKQEEENHPIVIHENDPYLLEKLKACPIAEVFVPLGIRTHGYCQDAIAYVKCKYVLPFVSL
jgi:hypothetical protein